MHNKYDHILSLLLSSVIACGCTQDFADFEIEVPTQQKDYIFFNANVPTTRGNMHTSEMLDKDFCVLGYRYAATWESEQQQARQDKRITYTNNLNELVLNTNTSADNYMGVFPPEASGIPTTATVTYANSIHAYDNVQEWQNKLKYAFFAWYPSTHSNISVYGDGYDSDSKSEEGNPHLTYTLPDNRTDMCDIMTDCHIDYMKTDGITVSLNMEHRLSALDVRVNSRVNGKALKESYSNVEAWKNIADDADVDIDVYSMMLTLDKIYTKATIPLNTEDETLKMAGSEAAEKTYTVGSTDAVLTKVNYSLDEKDAVSLFQDGNMLILIPQTDKLKATVSLTYKLTCNGYTHTETFEQNAECNLSGLTRGNFRYLLITVSKSGLSVQPSREANWTPVDVKHEFE